MQITQMSSTNRPSRKEINSLFFFKNNALALSMWLQCEWKLGRKSEVKFGYPMCPMRSVMWQGFFSLLCHWLETGPGHQPVALPISCSRQLKFWAHWSPWQTLGWRYQGHDAQPCWGMHRNHSDITSPPHSDHVPMSHTQPKRLVRKLTYSSIPK